MKAEFCPLWCCGFVVSPRNSYCWIHIKDIVVLHTSCFMMISYSVSINLIEGLWLSKVKKFYPNATDFMNYGAKISLFTGIFTLICSMTCGSVVRIFGWFTGAILTPAMILIVGSTFFLCVLFQSNLENLTLKFGLAVLPALVFIGGLQNVLSKGIKYSIFDSTKEMAYIPLNAELKTKGKAAVEILGAKIGKASGAIVQSGIFFLFPNARYDDIVPLLMFIFIAVLIFWLYDVKLISQAYKKLDKS